MTPVCLYLASGVAKLLADSAARGSISGQEIVASLARAMSLGAFDAGDVRRAGLDPALLGRCATGSGPVCQYLAQGVADLFARAVANGVFPASALVTALSVGYRQGLVRMKSLRALGLDPATLQGCEVWPAPGSYTANSLAAANIPFASMNLRHLKG